MEDYQHSRELASKFTWSRKGGLLAWMKALFSFSVRSTQVISCYLKPNQGSWFTLTNHAYGASRCKIHPKFCFQDPRLFVQMGKGINSQLLKLPVE